MITTLYPNQPCTALIRSDRQGRSRKQLKLAIEHDGRVFVARYEGRPGRYFGPTEKAALNNLQAGGQ
jgi:hypothetical protein